MIDKRDSVFSTTALWQYKLQIQMSTFTRS